MKGNVLIVIGLLFVAAGVAGFVHPQWQGRDKEMDVEVAGQKLKVTTRRVTDIPPVFSGAVLVAGICVAALGAISRTKPRPS